MAAHFTLLYPKKRIASLVTEDCPAAVIEANPPLPVEDSPLQPYDVTNEEVLPQELPQTDLPVWHPWKFWPRRWTRPSDCPDSHILPRCCAAAAYADAVPCTTWFRLPRRSTSAVANSPPPPLATTGGVAAPRRATPLAGNSATGPSPQDHPVPCGP
jgi:hypothetical protein